MNTSTASNKSSLTAGAPCSGSALEVKGAEARGARRIAKCLIAPAVVAMIMFGAHWQVFGSVNTSEAAAEEAEIEYLPATYAFRPIDFDDPVTAY